MDEMTTALPTRENAFTAYFKASKRRSSNVELLRFVAMAFILIGHCCVFSGFSPKASVDVFGHAMFMFHDHLSQVGNGLFIAVLSFFLFSDSSAKKPVWKRMLSMYMPCLFYSLLLYGIYCASGRTPTVNMDQAGLLADAI